MSIVFKGHSNPAKDAPFNFDLEQMKKAIDAPIHTPPRNLSRKELHAWMKSKVTNIREPYEC